MFLLMLCQLWTGSDIMNYELNGHISYHWRVALSVWLVWFLYTCVGLDFFSASSFLQLQLWPNQIQSCKPLITWTLTEPEPEQWPNRTEPEPSLLGSIPIFSMNSLFRKDLRQTGTNWDEILHRDVGSGGTLSCKLLVQSAKRVQNAFSDLFVTKTTHRFTHFPPADFLEIWTQNVNFFGTDLRIFFQKVIIYRQKTSF